jgi:hypothetical protein
VRAGAVVGRVRGAALALALPALVVLPLAGCRRDDPRAVPPTPPSPATTTWTAAPLTPVPAPSRSVATTSATPGPTGTSLRVTGDQAAKLLLVPEDLPTGYQVDPTVGPDRWSDLPPGCPLLDGFGRLLRGAPVRAARGFIGGQLGPFLVERVAVPTGSAASQLDRLAAAAVRCRTFVSRDSDGVSVRFSVSRSAVPAGPAEQAVGLSLSGRSPGTGTLRCALTAIRRGNTVVTLVSSGTDKPDPQVTKAALSTIQATIARF